MYQGEYVIIVSIE